MTEQVFQRVRRCLQNLLVTVFIVTVSHASALTLISDDRMVQNFSDDGTVISTPPTPFANWSQANQTSNITNDRFMGVGTGSGESDFFFSITESIFDVTFSVAVATLLDLEGTLSGEDGNFGLGGAEVALYAGSSTSDPLLFSAFGGGGNFIPFSFVDTLNAGTYRLVLQTNITPGGFGTFGEWTFLADFTATPVPIPAMGWLVGLLVLGLARRRSH